MSLKRNNFCGNILHVEFRVPLSRCGGSCRMWKSWEISVIASDYGSQNKMAVEDSSPGAVRKGKCAWKHEDRTKLCDIMDVWKTPDVSRYAHRPFVENHAWGYILIAPMNDSHQFYLLTVCWTWLCHRPTPMFFFYPRLCMVEYCGNGVKFGSLVYLAHK